MSESKRTITVIPEIEFVKSNAIRHSYNRFSSQSNFLSSLGINTQKWTKVQTAKFEKSEEFTIFGLSIPIEEIESDTWIWKILDTGYTRRLEINNKVVALAIDDASIVNGEIQTKIISEIPDNVKYLRIESSSSIKNLNSICYIKNLKGLNIRKKNTIEKEASEITDISPVCIFKNLISLDICYLEVEDLSPLINIPNIKRLNISNCTRIKDLNPINKLNQIEELFAVECLGINDISPIVNLKRLVSLDISGCKEISNINKLSEFKNLKKIKFSNISNIIDLNFLREMTGLTDLDASSCKSLSNILGICDLKKLKYISFKNNREIKDISVFCNLTELKYLNISGCHGIRDITPIGCLTGLQELDMSELRSINDCRPFRKLSNLERLNLSNCELLQDLDKEIEGLFNLKKLNISGCLSVYNINFVSSMHELCDFDISNCQNIKNLDSLKQVPQLTRFEFSGCSSLVDVSGLQNSREIEDLFFDRIPLIEDLNSISILIKLKKLRISESPLIKSFDFLSELKFLEELKLSNCENLENLECLDNKERLSILEISDCVNLDDISSLKSLSNLKQLEIFRCPAIQKFAPLSELVNLEKLSLVWCNGLDNIDPIGSCKKLKKLWIKGFEYSDDISFEAVVEDYYSVVDKGFNPIQDISSLSDLKELEILDLENCSSISDLSALANLSNLSYLNIKDLKRIRSLEPLRGISPLKKILHSFHPGVVADILSYNGLLRGDAPYLDKNCAEWLREAEFFEPSMPGEKESLFTNLAGVFTYLNGHRLQDRFEKILYSNTKFSSSPWKAWFGGTFRAAGFDLYRMRVERVSFMSMTAGAIGGVCATLPMSELGWSLQWLAELEKERSGNAKELLPVAPEICLAYARFGEMEALGRWLERLTDPSDPGALDPLHAQFAKWQLGQGNTLEALNHIAAINSPSVSDPLYAALSLYWLKDQPIKSGEVLLMIESSRIRRETGIKLASDEGFAKSPENIHRLIAAVGDSASSLAAILEALGDRADSALIKELTAYLKLPDEDFKALRIARLETMLKEAKTS